MKAISGIVTHAQATERTSDIAASVIHDCKFSIGNAEIIFSSSSVADIAVGDMVIAAGNFKGERMTAFAVYNLSNKTQKSSGIVSNLFGAVFALIVGLFSVVITAAFLLPFAYAIFAVASIAVSYFLYRFFIYGCQHIGVVPLPELGNGR